MRNYPECLLDPAQSAVIIIDHQPQMYFGVESAARCAIENNILGLAKAAQLFGVPCILTTVAAQTFSGPMYAKLQAIDPQTAPIDRTCINAWEDANLKQAVLGANRRQLLIAGLWTEACVAFPALSMRAEGRDVFAVTDACGGASPQAHDMAVLRMTQAGVKPVTWMQVMLEWQRDWSNQETYDGVMNIVKEHGGTYGLGVEYAETMGIAAQ